MSLESIQDLTDFYLSFNLKWDASAAAKVWTKLLTTQHFKSKEKVIEVGLKQSRPEFQSKIKNTGLAQPRI